MEKLNEKKMKEEIEKKKIEIDISGRIDQKSYDSVVVMLNKDRKFENSIILDSKLKKEILNKNKEVKDIVVKLHCILIYKKVKDIVVKLHCILIYYCIRDYIDKISDIQVCPDCSPKKIDQYLKFYFKEHKEFDKIKKKIKGIKHSSLCHKKAIRIFRKKEKPNLKISKDMILTLLKQKRREK